MATKTLTEVKPLQPKPIFSKWIIAGLAVVILIVMGSFFPVREYFMALLEWTESLGTWGPLVVIGAYLVACVFFLPGSILTLGAGFLFGLVTGCVTVSIGSTLGAGAAFLVGRTIARDSIAKKMENHKKFNAIDQAVGRQGFKIVFLTRLSPVFPFNLLNYAFGLTTVSFWKYLLASWVGMMPGTVMYVYIGSTARSLAELATGEYQGPNVYFVIFTLLATLLVVGYVTRVARKSLAEVEQEK